MSPKKKNLFSLQLQQQRIRLSSILEQTRETAIMEDFTQNPHQPIGVQISYYLQVKLTLQRILTTLTGKCPKHFEDFIVRIRDKNSQFPGEFVGISGSKGHFHFVTQCLHLGILRLSTLHKSVFKLVSVYNP